MPLGIQAAYPDAVGQIEFFARHPQDSINMSAVRIRIYALMDGETVIAVQIRIT